jgi:hypothetical protein
LGIYGLFCEAAQHFSIVRVFQLLHRFGDGQPLELVDFGVGCEFTGAALRRPVPHLFHALLDGITDGGQPPAQV